MSCPPLEFRAQTHDERLISRHRRDEQEQDRLPERGALCRPRTPVRWANPAWFSLLASPAGAGATTRGRLDSAWPVLHEGGALLEEGWGCFG